MTPFALRTTAPIFAWLACLLAVLGLAACSPAPAVSTAVPPSATASPTSEPSATRTASPMPATATETPAPPTATVRVTATASRTRAASPTPTSTAAATATNTAPPAGSGDFTPTQAQVWNTAVVGGDNTSGTCTSTANAPYGLMQLTPGDGTLAMHNTVPEDYVLTRLGDNAYQFSGAAALGDGTITLDLRFTSATTLTMSRIFVSNAEPGCTHQHNYTGTFRNNR